jgi:demethylspheroidene O-methyltransferase
MLLDRDMTVAALSHVVAVPPDRMQVVDSAVSLGILLKSTHWAYLLTRRCGASARIAGMIAHHDVLYQDRVRPVAFFRGEVKTELADLRSRLWGGC